MKAFSFPTWGILFLQFVPCALFLSRVSSQRFSWCHLNTITFKVTCFCLMYFRTSGTDITLDTGACGRTLQLNLCIDGCTLISMTFEDSFEVIQVKEKSATRHFHSDYNVFVLLNLAQLDCLHGKLRCFMKTIFADLLTSHMTKRSQSPVLLHCK